MKSIFKKSMAVLLAVVMLMSVMSTAIFTVGAAETAYPSLTLDVEQTATISEEAEEVYFSFTPEEDGLYSFVSYADEDTYANLYDESMEYLTDDDDSGEEYNFAITYELTAGETYILGVCYYDEYDTGSFPIKVVKTPKIQSVAVNPLSIVENNGGFWDEYYIEETGEYEEYYVYEWWWNLSFTVTLDNEDVVEAIGGYYEYDGIEYELDYDYEDTQSYENQWTVGNTYTQSVTISDEPYEVDITITGSPVKKVEVEPISYIEYTNGYFSGDYNEETDEYDLEYYKYDWWYDLSYTITLKDNSVIHGEGLELEYDGVWYYIDCHYGHAQDYENQWTKGNTYTELITVLGYETEAEISIVKSPVKKITINPLTMGVYTGGDWYWGYNEDIEDYEDYYEYYWWDNLSYTITLKDGTVIKATGIEFEYDDDWYYIDGSESQAYDNQWTVGNTYTETVYILGYKTEVKIEITKDTLIKGEDGKWYYYKNGEQTNATTLVKYNGQWFYVKNGVWDKSATTLVKYNNKWLYVKNGKWDKKATTLVKYDGQWFYIENGVWTKSTTLVKYEGQWFYVKNGKWDKSATTLVKYDGKWFYVKNGKWDNTANTLVKYNNKWLYVKNGKWASSATAIVKYNGKKIYVKKGVAQLSFSGKVEIDGKTYKIKNGQVV